MRTFLGHWGLKIRWAACSKFFFFSQKLTCHHVQPRRGAHILILTLGVFAVAVSLKTFLAEISALFDLPCI